MGMYLGVEGKQDGYVPGCRGVAGWVCTWVWRGSRMGMHLGVEWRGSRMGMHLCRDKISIFRCV